MNSINTIMYNYIEEKTESILVENNMFRVGFNINSLVEKYHIQLITKKLPSDISGLFVMTDHKPVIVINEEEKNKLRNRFTIAHEFGHFSLHRNDKSIFIDKKPKVLFRTSEKNDKNYHKEREANAFAAALLMPKKLINQEVQEISEVDTSPVKTLAQRFKVSESAMSFRLINLGFELH